MAFLIMRDKISIPRVAELHPAIVNEVEQKIDEAEALIADNVAMRVVQANRTIAYQNDLYAQGRTKPGPIVTKARGGESYHNYGLAFDFAFVIDRDRNGTYEEMSWDTRADFDKDGIPDWREVVNVFRAAGYIWGADWDNDGVTKAEGDRDEHLVDAPHLQKTFGYSVHQLYQKYISKDFIPGTMYVKL